MNLRKDQLHDTHFKTRKLTLLVLTFFESEIWVWCAKIFYNFWRWMSRLEQRWRTPQNAISVVNGRIPRIKRKLNAYCAFRFPLRACLVQGVYTVMSWDKVGNVLSYLSDVFVRQWREAHLIFFHWRIRLFGKCSKSWCWLFFLFEVSQYLAWAVELPCRSVFTVAYELKQDYPLNLSI